MRKNYFYEGGVNFKKGIILKMRLADFKRMATVGKKIRGGYFWKAGLGTSDISGCEWRTITAVQSNSIRINGSYLDYPKANACEFDGKILKIYETGYRPLNEEEKKALEEWKAIAETDEYKRQAEIDLLTDSNTTYWQEKRFFDERNMEHLFTPTDSKELDHNRYNRGEEYCVRDNKAEHGKQIAEYELGE